jgi:methylmalonyl-CoA/ethylmalonyl-CoA epimerase
MEKEMKILGIDHIGVATKSIDQSSPFWNADLGLPSPEKETVAEQKVTTLLLLAGESEIELLEATAPESAIAKFIANRGEGMHHIALRVENIEDALKELQDKGIRLIDEKPRKGARGSTVAFIHPQSTHGVLVELVQRD